MQSTSGQKHGHGHGHNHEPHTHHTESAPTSGRVIRYARAYDPLVWLMARGNTRTLRALPLDLAALQPGERVLDVGCGTGDLALLAASQLGPHGVVRGIDASSEMIEVARAKARRARYPENAVQFQVEPVEQMSFPDASFDVFLSSLMLHHLPGDLKRLALAEIRRVLRPGGRIVIVDLQPMTRRPRPWDPGWLIMQRHGMRISTHEQVHEAQSVLSALLQHAGFEAIDVGSTRYPYLGYARAHAPA
jgi:demethylmenaquinone methyltransferase/2-methoxy-6-polyprenyl-1,4-benzoquinol methylase/phosphoethanolamine N-methyltransferase